MLRPRFVLCRVLCRVPLPSQADDEHARVRAVRIAAVLSIAATVSLTGAPSEVLVNKHRVVYESRGSGEPALVLVHGWTCERSLWAPQINAFSAKYRVIAIDLPGHGESDKPEDVIYDSKLFARGVLG